MTQPQLDPDTSAALARAAEQIAGLQRQVDHLDGLIRESEGRTVALTDAKFVTYRTLIDSQAEKVKLALEATEKAIDKAEIATAKAIDKAEIANDARFAAVNEFRSQQSDLIARFATLERVDLLYSQSRQRMEEINTNIQDRLTELATRITTVEALARGAAASKTGTYAAIAAVGVLLAIVITVANVLSSGG
jgi:hypothetical protein